MEGTDHPIMSVEEPQDSMQSNAFIHSLYAHLLESLELITCILPFVTQK